MITVVRKSPRNGEVHQMDLDITMEQVAAYDAGALIQVAFPNLTKAEREFYKTGYTQDDWDIIFGPTIDPALIADDSAEASTLFGPLSKCLEKYGNKIVPSSFTSGNDEFSCVGFKQKDGDLLSWTFKGESSGRIITVFYD